MKKITLYFMCMMCAYGFSQNIELELFASGFSDPIKVQNAGDDRLFVTEQDGTIQILNTDGTTNSTPFLDIDARVASGGERGLLSLAFHPNYASNGYFYVNYTNNSGDTVISRFSRSTVSTADSGSELILMTIPQPYSNHNGGDLHFGPNDGYLYISTGDGGSGGDPGDRSQDLMELLGKMLRIDVDNVANGNNYAIPTDNPFVGNPNALEEIWAYGLRNPWRFSFDEETNEMWIGDVGQNTTEEVNRVAVNPVGYNFGWRCYEGSNTYNTNGCPAMETLTFPVAEYPIPPCFCNIAGGQVYRGSVYSDIFGVYIFGTTGDFTISTVDASNNLINHGAFNNGYWVSFGEDINKEMYAVDITGSIYRVKGTVLSVSEFEKQNISITPNPASENLNITLFNNTINAISIIGLNGSVLFNEENILLSEKNIDVSFLSNGMYLINIEFNDKSTIVKKLIVK
ncbi:PQQ-dependent sugar dehydrogenase [Psychroserpens ponticola]|uniref:PQQ-dependent sugar dehydrogenase n=1 Tax=Psychroserpens ponticola TaxID=2932268 RepID=A0ABY7RTU2_9FLAO|nr:PQQ-dependent sugar dehydrogenase [Psychroserpens ponticola]WCO00535.1 PQQ-dependent sugar dehydrogenase [Psychroserpens ponticola]